MRNLRSLSLFVAASVAAPAAAQLALPGSGALGPLTDRLGRTIEHIGRQVDVVRQTADELLAARNDRFADLVRRNRGAIEFDASGSPARRGELLLTGATEADLAAAREAGYTLLGTDALPALGVEVARMGVPRGRPLAQAERELQQLLPTVDISADALHFPSGGHAVVAPGRPENPRSVIGQAVGVIDGAPAAGVGVGVRGFARGAPKPNDHASAVVSLLRAAGVQRIAVADVYGTDPAGGNALAIAQGLDWLVGGGARVISISLVGPRNLLLARAIASAQQHGAWIVAAVGNDGPAAPPAYPASYPGVIAVTAVDGRNRALIEAGRATHLDYAAPGADLLAAGANGRWSRVRGTSYAVPLVAARAAAAIGRGPVIATLDREALDLGAKGPDPVYGRGLLCGDCARTK